MNQQETKKYRVTIFGDSYTLVSDEQETRIAKAAQLVDQAMQEIASAGVIEPKKVAVLAALRVATMLQELDGERDAWQGLYKKLMHLIDAETVSA